MTQRPFSSQPDDPDDDAFDDALSALQRGDRDAARTIDAEMASTIDQLFGWAELSGFASEPATHASFGETSANPSRPSSESRRRPGPPTRPTVSRESSIYPTSNSRTRRSYSIMGFFSGLAIAALIAASVFGARPLFDHHTPTPTELAFQELPGSPTVQIAGGEDVVPNQATPSKTPMPNFTPDPNQTYVVPPLDASDCTAKPRTRQEMLDILSNPPDVLSPDPNPEDGIFSGNEVADQSTIDEFNQLLRAWQTCAAFGLTGQTWAYESKTYIREDFYGDPRISKAYSPSTLSELIDARYQIDEDKITRGNLGDNDILTIDPNNPVMITDDTVQIRSAQAMVIFVSPQTGSLEGGPYHIAFVWQDGGWKVHLQDPGYSIG